MLKSPSQTLEPTMEHEALDQRAQLLVTATLTMYVMGRSKWV